MLFINNCLIYFEWNNEKAFQCRNLVCFLYWNENQNPDVSGMKVNVQKLEKPLPTALSSNFHGWWKRWQMTEALFSKTNSWGFLEDYNDFKRNHGDLSYSVLIVKKGGFFGSIFPLFFFLFYLKAWWDLKVETSSLLTFLTSIILSRDGTDITL